MEFGSSKAKLGKILETSLANKRAADDLMGISGIKGAFVVDMSGSTPITMSIATTTAGTVEIQTISFDNTPTSGSWELSYDGAGTGALAWNISSANLQTALRTIPDLASVTVSGSMAAGFSISMVGVAAPLLIVMAANTLMASVVPVVETIAVDTPYVTEIQHIDFDAVPEYQLGTWTLSFAGNATAAMAYDANAAAVQSALQLVPGLASVTVAGDYTAGFDITMTGCAAPALLVAPANTLALLDQAVTLTPAISNAGVTEIQTIDFEGKTPTAGSYTIDFGGGRVTAAIAWNDDAAATQVIVRATDATLANVTVTGTYATDLTITFDGCAGPQTLMVVPAHTLVDGGGAIVITPALDTAGEYEVQTITPDFTPYAGAWKFNYGAWTTANIAWNTATATIQTTIRNLDASLANITVTGDFLTALTITYIGVPNPVTACTVADVTLESNGTAVTVTPSVGTPETVEIQNVSFGATPTSGSWTLSYAGNATGALAYNISAVDLQTALQLVVGLGSVTVAGSMAAGFDITMTGISAPALLVMASNTLMSDIAVVETIAVGTPWVPAQETISFSDVPTAGSWELNYGADLSGALAWNISAVNLQAALQAMPGLGSVTVAGSFATNFVVTMAGVALPVTTFGEEANTLERPGVADAIDVGTGFSAEPGSTAGSFNIYLDKRPVNYLGSKVSVFTPKATAANGDIFEADVSAYNFSASRPYVTVRIVNKTTRAVYAPLASCVFMFEINCTYSDDSGY